MVRTCEAVTAGSGVASAGRTALQTSSRRDAKRRARSTEAGVAAARATDPQAGMVVVVVVDVGVPQTPAWHTVPVVAALPSSQAVPSARSNTVQLPSRGVQCATAQVVAAPHALVPVQLPATQRSPVVHGSASSQPVPSGCPPHEASPVPYTIVPNSAGAPPSQCCSKSIASAVGVPPESNSATRTTNRPVV
jgi:hypothetical protein